MSAGRPPAQPPIIATRLDRLAGLLAALMVLASLANGAGPFLRRIGLIDGQAYQRDLLRFCTQPIQQLWLPASCHFRRVLSLQPLRVERIDPERLYQANAAEIGLKLLKFGLVGGLILLSIALILSRWTPAPRWRQLRPALPLALSIAISLAFTLNRNGLALALGSLLSITWVPLLVVGGWLSTAERLRRLADGVAILLLLQLPLALLEAIRGLPLPFGNFRDTLVRPALPVPSRLFQAFILPNSLGVFAVCALAFWLSFSGRRGWRPWLVGTCLLLVLLARSAAGCLGLLALAALAGLPALSPPPGTHRGRQAPAWIAATALLLGGLGWGLPRLLGRADLLQSLQGRLLPLLSLLDPQRPLQVLLGQGLGAAGNRLYGMLAAGDRLSLGLGPLEPASLAIPGPGDSQLVLLLVQGGLLAVAAFYGLLVYGLRRDRAARPFLVCVLLCSLTLNVSELFPIELLLPLALIHSLSAPALRLAAAERPAPAGPRPSPATPASAPGG